MVAACRECRDRLERVAVRREGPGLKRPMEKLARNRKRTSAAKAAVRKGAYGKAEAVPLSKTPISAISKTPLDVG